MSLLDPLLSSGNTVPDVFNFMRQKWLQAMETRNKELQQEHKGRDGEPPQIDIDKALSEADVFINFARSYLTRHRPSQISPAEMNYCIQLEGATDSFLIAPAVEIVRGSMQASHATPVTGRAYYEEAMGSGVMPITGRRLPVPKGAEDRSQNSGTKDMTQAQGPKNYAQ